MAKSQAYSAFHTAVGFHEAAHRAAVSVKDELNGTMVVTPVPAVTLAAFAAELYLKSLILDRNPGIRGHNLHELYTRGLTDEEKREVVFHYWLFTSAKEDDLLEHLAKFKLTFFEWRYWYELKLGEQVDAGCVFRFARALFATICKLRPDFKTTPYLTKRVQVPAPFAALVSFGNGRIALARFIEATVQPHPLFSERENYRFTPSVWRLIPNSKSATLNMKLRWPPDGEDFRSGKTS